MFTSDESPSHIDASPAAQAHLAALATSSGGVTVHLTDRGAAILKAGQQPPAGTVYLGYLDEAGSITCVADDTPAHGWWRTRAHLDLTADSDMSYALTSLSEPELFAALAAGPMRRY
jgi:hypothetical protein